MAQVCILKTVLVALLYNTEDQGSIKSACKLVDYVLCSFESFSKVSKVLMKIFRFCLLYKENQGSLKSACKFVDSVFCHF